MTAESGGAVPKRERQFPVMAVFILAAMLAVAGGFWYLDHQSKNIAPAKERYYLSIGIHKL